MKKLFCVLILLLALACVFVACNSERSITKSEIVNGELVITYSDDTTENLGKVVANDGAKGEAVALKPINPQGYEFHMINDDAYGIKLGDAIWMEEIKIPESYLGKPVVKILDEGFKGATKVKKIIIPSTITTISTSAFSGCTSLTSVEIAASVTSIGSSAFSGCTKLTSITIPASVTSIGSSAFYNCTSLTSVTFAENSQLTSIGSSAFEYCTSLASIEIPASVTSIGSSAFYRCISLASIEIPASVTSIGSSAFSNCPSLNYTVYNNGKYLGNASNPYLYLVGMVDNSVTSFTISNTAKFIGSSAFYNCPSLTSIDIPASVTSIGSSAFSNCTSLASVTFENTNGWWYSSSSDATSGTSISATGLADPATAAAYLRWTYEDDYWKRS